MRTHRTKLPSLLTLLLLALVVPALAALAAPAAGEPPASAAPQDDGQAADDPNVVIDPSLYEAMDYRHIGPFRGGRSTAVAGVRQDTETFYMGTTGGGVWKTTDGGEIWDNVSDGFFSVGSIGAIAVAPTDPNLVFVGTGSACPRGNISTGKGVYRSTDAGDSWDFIGLPHAGQIGRVVVDPRNPDRVFVAALGNIFGPNPERGVYRSDDGGSTWEQVLFVSERTGAVDIAMDATNPRILLAAMWTAERRPWSLLDGSEESGVYRSTDGGTTWTRLSGAAEGSPGHGLPGGLLGRAGVTISGADPDRMWVLQQAAEEEDGGVYRSDDGGDTWRRVNRDHKLRQRGWYYSHIYADPRDPDTVYALNTGFYRSNDGGRTFDDRISVPHGDNHDLWIHPDHPQTMINANDGGSNVSTNAGASWSTQRNQPTAEFYRVEVDNAFPYRVYGAQQDNSTITVPSRSPGGITPKQHWYSIGGGESGHIAVHPDNPDVVWAGTYSGEITRVDVSKGYSRQVTEYPHYTEGWEMRDLKYRFQWNAPIEISPHDPDVVYHASQFVHRTSDGGQTWQIISPDLTRPDDEHLGIPGGPIQYDATGVEVYHSIFALAPSKTDPDTIWAGTDDGLVHVTRDGGGTWQDVTPARMPHEGTVNSIDLSAHRDGRAYISVYRYRENDFRPYIFKTDDFGASWELLTTVEGPDGTGTGPVSHADTTTNGIPADHFVRVVREDPDREGLLYAGTEYGVYVSFDDGTHWQSLQLDLPRTPVTDMLVHRQDLVVSTQGRSFWILDDLTPLHQLVDMLRSNGTEGGIPTAMTESGSHLFAPRDAHRTQLSGFFGGRHTPDPIPRGAEIFFWLSDDASAEPVRLEILDGNGAVIRTYSTASEDGADPLDVDAGMNKVQWDLRYPGPFLVPDLVTMVMRNPAPGPTAPTGTYRVRMTVGDRAPATRELRVGMDPRWDGSVSTADLEAQLDLALEIRDAISETQHMVRSLRSAREQAREAASRAAELARPEPATTPAVGPEVTPEQADALEQAADELGAALTELEEILIQNRIESSQDAIGMERRFTNHIGRLYGLVLGEDARPSGGVLERWADMQEELDGYRARFRALMQEDVPAFSRRAQELGLPTIIVTPGS